MTDHSESPRYLSPPTTLDENSANEAIKRLESLIGGKSYTIPDAALIILLPILASVVEACCLSPTALQMTWRLYYDMLSRLEHLAPGLAGATQLDQVSRSPTPVPLENYSPEFSDPEWDVYQWTTSKESGS